MLLSSQGYAEDCIATPQMGMGTHFEPVTEHKIDVGQGLMVNGKVLSTLDCKPIANVRIEHWQMNTKGKYVDELRAYLHSDEKGEFRFETEWPGSDVPHIHFIIYAESYKKLVYVWIPSKKTRNIDLEFVLESKDKQTLTKLSH
jgi:protocatechuate 3,4-dioxygenase beta subunit